MLLLATYPSSHAALKAEQQLKATGLSVELIPVPRTVRSTCGFCLLVDVQDEGISLQKSGAERLWRVLEPPPGQHRRTYEPHK